MKKIILLVFLLSSLASYSQCIVTSDVFPVYTAQNFGLEESMTIVIYTGDFHHVDGLIVGNDYQFACTSTGGTTQKYITVTDNFDAVLAHGMSPLTVTEISESQIKLHYTDNAACDVTFGIANTVTLQCVSTSCNVAGLSNDDCVDAIDLDPYFNLDDSCTLLYEGHNIGATNSSSEIAPSSECADEDDTPADVWFSLTVPANGMFSYDQVSSPGISSLVEVYTGTCGNLTALAPVNCSSLFEEIEFTGLVPGSTVYLRYWDYESNDEGALSFCLKDNTPVSVDENIRESISIYPNPIQSEFTIQALDENIQEITIYNVLGEVMLNSKPNTYQQQLALDFLKSGAYFVQVRINKNTVVFKVIKE